MEQISGKEIEYGAKEERVTFNDKAADKGHLVGCFCYCFCRLEKEEEQHKVEQERCFLCGQLTSYRHTQPQQDNPPNKQP